MSLLYSILKPIVRKKIKGSNLHQEESYEEFKRMSYEVQSKFQFALPEIKDYEFRDEALDGFHVIAGKRKGTMRQSPIWAASCSSSHHRSSP